MCRVDGDGRQNRKYFLAEQLLQVIDLVGGEIAGFVDHHILGKQFLAQALPVVLLFQLEMLGKRRNLLHLLGRRHAIGAELAESSAHLTLDPGNAHHEEFIEIVG